MKYKFQHYLARMQILQYSWIQRAHSRIRSQGNPLKIQQNDLLKHKNTAKNNHRLAPVHHIVSPKAALKQILHSRSPSPDAAQFNSTHYYTWFAQTHAHAYKKKRRNQLLTCSINFLSMSCFCISSLVGSPICFWR